MFIHVTTTWLLTNLLHPLMLLIIYKTGDSWLPPAGEATGIIVMMILYSFIFSLPSLVIALLTMQGIHKTSLSATVKFFIWFLLGPVIIFLNAWLILLFFGETILNTEVISQISIAPVISLCIVTLIRTGYFFKVFRQTQNNDHETNLV